MPDADKVYEEMDGLVAEDFTVEKIRSSSYSKSQRQVLYLVQWQGYPDQKDWTEEPYEHFEDEDVRNMVREFHLENPHLPMDRRVTL